MASPPAPLVAHAVAAVQAEVLVRTAVLVILHQHLLLKDSLVVVVLTVL